MDFRRLSPEIRWQSCLSPDPPVPDRQPGPPCPYHPSLEPLVERAVVHVRRTAFPRIGGRRLRGNVPLPFPASQPLGMESVSVLRAARAVHVRAGSAVLERARHPPAAARLARSGVSHHRRAGGLFGARHTVLLRAPLYRQPPMGVGRGAGTQLPLSFLWPV